MPCSEAIRRPAASYEFVLHLPAGGAGCGHSGPWRCQQPEQAQPLALRPEEPPGPQLSQAQEAEGAGGSGSRSSRINHATTGLNRHGLPFADFDFFQHAGPRATEFPRLLCPVENLEQRLVALHLSPGFLSHLVNRPSKILSPIWAYDVNGHDRSPLPQNPNTAPIPSRQ